MCQSETRAHSVTQDLVFEAIDAIAAEYHTAEDDWLADTMQSFKSMLEWVASSELRIIVMLHDKLVSAFISVMWTREINSKTLEM